MWTRIVFGTEFYNVFQWFMIYSILGWVVESIYMSICNRKLTNRGFVWGPFCPIYGVGALTVYFLLKPICHNLVLLYLLGCLVPTALELITAMVMQKIFGEVWWDYSDKPFNYKGILCLESTIAWGFYTLGLFLFLQRGVEHIVSFYPYEMGKKVGGFLFLLFLADFIHTLYREKRDCFEGTIEDIKDGIREFCGR